MGRRRPGPAEPRLMAGRHRGGGPCGARRSPAPPGRLQPPGARGQGGGGDPGCRAGPRAARRRQRRDGAGAGPSASRRRLPRLHRRAGHGLSERLPRAALPRARRRRPGKRPRGAQDLPLPRPPAAPAPEGFMTLPLTPTAERTEATAPPAARAASAWVPGSGTQGPLVSLHRDVPPALLPALGGKGRGLARLEALGHDVPPWYAVTTAAFTAALATGSLAARIAARLADLPSGSTAALREAAADIHGWILATEPPAGLAAAVAAAHAACLPGDGAAALRSSAGEEDGESASFAGLHDSLLGVRGIPAVL